MKKTTSWGQPEARHWDWQAVIVEVGCDVEAKLGGEDSGKA